MLKRHLTEAGLSNRECEVAGLVATGLSNKDVADRLFVTEKTIKFHLTNIYKKMSIRSRTQLIVWCLPHMQFEEQPGEVVPAIVAPSQIAQPAQGAQINPHVGQPMNPNFNNNIRQLPVEQAPAAPAQSESTDAAPAADNITTLAAGQIGINGFDAGSNNGGSFGAFG